MKKRGSGEFVSLSLPSPLLAWVINPHPDQYRRPGRIRIKLGSCSGDPFSPPPPTPHSFSPMYLHTFLQFTPGGKLWVKSRSPSLVGTGRRKKKEKGCFKKKKEKKTSTSPHPTTNGVACKMEAQSECVRAFFFFFNVPNHQQWHAKLSRKFIKSPLLVGQAIEFTISLFHSSLSLSFFFISLSECQQEGGGGGGWWSEPQN